MERDQATKFINDLLKLMVSRGINQNVEVKASNSNDQ